MKIALGKKPALFFYAIVFCSVTISFAIKLLGYYHAIPWMIGYGDILPWSERAFAPGIPYIDKIFEYPPVIGMIIHLASRSTFLAYAIMHYLLFLSAALISTYYLYQMSPKKNLLLFWTLSPSLLWFSYFNWDLIAVMFCIMSFYHFKKGNDIFGTIFMALGFSTKIYPALFLIPLLLHKKCIRWTKWIMIPATFAATVLLVNIYFIINGFAVWLSTYTFHGVRPPNIDSIWQVVSYLIPLDIKEINLWSMFLFGVGYLLLIVYMRHRDYTVLSFSALLLFLITNKVFSPQYLLWLLPFFVMYGVGSAHYYALESANLLVLFTTLAYIFSGQTSAVALFASGFFVVIRHIALLLILISVLSALQIRENRQE